MYNIISRDILNTSVYLLQSLEKSYIENIIQVKDEVLNIYGIEDISIFISTFGKKEYISFPLNTLTIFREKVTIGMSHPDSFKSLISKKKIQNLSIMPILLSIGPYREALILLHIKDNTKIQEREFKILKSYLEDKIKTIYEYGKKLIKEGESLSSLLYILNKKESSFLEKINIIFKLAQKIAREGKDFNMNPTEFLFIILVYDLGKLFLRDGILSGTNKVEEKDRITISNHPYYTLNLLNYLPIPNKVKSIIESHHENYNGSGYPHKLIGEEIPNGARLLRILDTLGSLMTFRPYKKKLTLKESLSVIEEDLGKSYDPKIGKSIVELLNKMEKFRTNYSKYTNMEVYITPKKQLRNKIKGRVKDGNSNILTIITGEYLPDFHISHSPLLPEDRVMLSFPSLKEEIQGKIVDVNYTPSCIINVMLISEKEIEIRKNPRTPWIIPLEIFDGKTKCIALTTDISSYGAQIIPLGRGSQKKFKRDIIDIDFSLPPNTENSIHFHVQGKVIRYSKNYTPPFYKIIKFIGFKKENHILLEEFIRERQFDILFLE